MTSGCSSSDTLSAGLAPETVCRGSWGSAEADAEGIERVAVGAASSRVGVSRTPPSPILSPGLLARAAPPTMTLLGGASLCCKLMHLAFQVSSSRRSSSSLVENLSIKACVATLLSSVCPPAIVTPIAKAPPRAGSAGLPDELEPEERNAGLRAGFVVLDPSLAWRKWGLTASPDGLFRKAAEAGGETFLLEDACLTQLPPAAEMAEATAAAAAAAALAAATAVAIFPRTTTSLPRRAFRSFSVFSAPPPIPCLPPDNDDDDSGLGWPLLTSPWSNPSLT